MFFFRSFFRSFFHLPPPRFLPPLLLLSLTPSFHPSFSLIEDNVVIKTRNTISKKIDELKRLYGTQMVNYPTPVIGIRGGRYFMEFLVDQRKTDLFEILVGVLDLMERNKEGGRIIVKNVTSWKGEGVVTMMVEFEECGDLKSKKYSKGSISISGEMSDDRPSVKFTIENSLDLTDLDVETFLLSYKEANKPSERPLKKRAVTQKKEEEGSTIGNYVGGALKGITSGKEKDEAVNKLQELGVTIFMPDKKKMNLDWDYLAGYERQKRDIEDTVLLALTYPEIYDEITKMTRMKEESNRPKAVLFEGPPGTGKTTSAKIIATQVNIPLIYMPIESIMSKYYGESEKRFADIFDACQDLGKAIVFIDEIDAIAASRNFEGIHEASRRILSTLLRKIDSFESSTDVLLICATNRKDDLDAALLSRIDMSVKFELPDKHSRAQIFKRYAKQLDKLDLEKLADLSEGLSGRNISDICKDSERRWVSKFIRKEVDEKIPSIDQYVESISSRRRQNLA